jgi:hypothetical protein
MMQVCICGRSFEQFSAFSKHQRTCQSTKKRLSCALGQAKQAWVAKKRRKLDLQVVEPTPEPTSAGLIRQSAPETQPVAVCMLELFFYCQYRLNHSNLQTMVEDFEDDADAHLSIMERRPWTQRVNRRLPQRFRDILPQPPPSIATSGVQLPTESVNQDPMVAHIRYNLCRFFTTPRNIFGLSRRYYTKEIPTHNPEDEISLQDLSNIIVHANPQDSPRQMYYPYPNYSAFRLGDWFWNGGVQKSQKNFRELVDIIGDPEFQQADVRDIQWDRINKELATDDEGEWLDEDAGWTRTPISVSVPYQPRRGVPSEPEASPQNYVVGDLYHRKLVSIIREKLSGSNDFRLFHLEPHELHWQLPNHPEPIRIQGELYTSPAFIDANRELQDGPGEPGCDLPRVVISLMFWSDATHLTAFGNAKLHPLYMFFGNESKYRRCKPSCHLCEHVAYFQSVSLNNGSSTVLLIQ